MNTWSDLVIDRNTTPPAHRRRSPRVRNRGDIDALCETRNGRLGVRLIDLAASGAAVIAPAPLGAVGTLTRLHLRLDARDTWLGVTCEFRHLALAGGLPEGWWHHGARFEQLSPRAWALLTDYVERESGPPI